MARWMLDISILKSKLHCSILNSFSICCNDTRLACQSPLPNVVFSDVFQNSFLLQGGSHRHIFFSLFKSVVVEVIGILKHIRLHLEWVQLHIVIQSFPQLLLLELLEKPEAAKVLNYKLKKVIDAIIIDFASCHPPRPDQDTIYARGPTCVACTPWSSSLLSYFEPIINTVCM